MAVEAEGEEMGEEEALWCSYQIRISSRQMYRCTRMRTWHIVASMSRTPKP